MSTPQRNDACRCGSGKKYKKCCMRKDEAQALLSQQKYDVSSVITPTTSPYIFWKRWSAACERNEFGLIYEMLLPEGDLAERFKTAEDFFVNLSDIGLPFEPVWNLDKIKLDETNCLFLCHRIDDVDKNADKVFSLVSLKRTAEGYRVESIQKKTIKASEDHILSFALFDIKSTEHDLIVKQLSGWERPNLADLTEELQNTDTD